MSINLRYETVSPLLKSILRLVMDAPEFASFRLVGGTALSLQRGHRMSVDIDLFTDALYRTIKLEDFKLFFEKHFEYVACGNLNIQSIGECYFVGNSASDSIKIDLFYTDPFIFPPVVSKGIRLASIEEIIAMKMDVIQRTGRKKDFWDIYELYNEYTLEKMLELHKKRYPYTHDRTLLIEQFTNFDAAEGDFEPDCLRGNYWELIKLDLIDYKNQFLSQK
jgi:hypothetical protein